MSASRHTNDMTNNDLYAGEKSLNLANLLILESDHSSFWGCALPHPDAPQKAADNAEDDVHHDPDSSGRESDFKH